jgi:hypothetical protein
VKLDRLTLVLLIGLELVQNLGGVGQSHTGLVEVLTLMAFARIYFVGRSFVQDLGPAADCFSTWESA